MNDEEVALPAEQLFVVVEGRGMSSEAGRDPLGENAPVSLLGLMSSGAPFPSLREHEGGTKRRGSEWIPRGEPEGGAAEFFIVLFFRPRWAGDAKKKAGLEKL